jgi:SAM-dependent methyltransferase
MRSSAALYDALAADYDEHFAAPHRRAYDDLAWDVASAAIGVEPTTIVDVGCGVGRWASRLVATGHRVVGIEPAPGMARRAAARLAGTDFVLIEAGVLEADPRPVLPAGGADAVLAMGSLQYSDDVRAALTRCASWLRPGGVLCALVDSRHALVLELLAAGRTDEALLRSTGRRGEWRIGTLTAELHLLDAAELGDAVRAAGLMVERLTGLLVGASAYGRAGLADRLTTDYARALAEERRLAELPELADLGKQLLVVARRPDA